jgi:hypothetical protein
MKTLLQIVAVEFIAVLWLEANSINFISICYVIRLEVQIETTYVDKRQLPRRKKCGKISGISQEHFTIKLRVLGQHFTSSLKRKLDFFANRFLGFG